MQDQPKVIGARPRLSQLWPLLAIGVLGLAVAGSPWIAVSVWEARLAKAKFNDVAGDYATVLQNGLNEYLDKIKALRALYDTSERVTRREFELFTSQILAGQDNIMRLVWCPRVTGEDREAFEGRVKASDLAEFSIKT